MDAELNSQRDDIRNWVDEFAYDVSKRALAHESSAEFHRSRGVLFGVCATGASAVAGAAMFLIATHRVDLGFDGGWTYAIGVMSLLAPVLMGIHANLRDAERAQAHRTASCTRSRAGETRSPRVTSAPSSSTSASSCSAAASPSRKKRCAARRDAYVAMAICVVRWSRPRR
jgi:hypothetical protein